MIRVIWIIGPLLCFSILGIYQLTISTWMINQRFRAKYLKTAILSEEDHSEMSLLQYNVHSYLFNR